MKQFFGLFFLLGICAHSWTQPTYHIIPLPVSISYGKTQSQLGKSICIINNSPELQEESKYLSSALQEAGYEVKLTESNKDKNVVDLLVDFTLVKNVTLPASTEAYELVLQNSVINIKAGSEAGIFRGIQTALQMIPFHKGMSVKLPDCRIEDFPRFQWRGLMLDVSRHFFSVAEVKAYIDQMARYKFNVFHWHLTDDEGWRIEIKSLPQLTEKGAWRVPRTGKFGTRPWPLPDEKPTYGGFYTQDEIKEVVAFAAERHITIVPEIDVPGHSMALLAAFPELSTKKEPKYVSCGFKFSEWYPNGTFEMLVENMLNPADSRVYEVLDKIFGEVAMLFPGSYIHAGGDECDHRYWAKDESCRQLMQREGLKDGVDLQSYFMNKINSIIESKGKKMIGWDEILHGGLAEGAAVMSWRGMKGGIEATRLGHKVVMSPTTHAYLDYTQGDHSLEFPIYSDLSLKKSYTLDPIPQGADSSLIMGGQGNLWTEHIPTLSHAFYMTYPRAFALAETLWSKQESKSWPNFISRVERQMVRFDEKGRSICKSLFDPWVRVKKKNNGIFCAIESELPEAQIRFTWDNTFPDMSSPLYTGESLELPDGEVILRAAVFKNGRQAGRTLSLSRSEIMARAK
ncbi:MAG: family 20 glycosylhydrolase [Saprospiraceae bacterium]|nr:family 20 glycosylhydrolase [Saprospiraceae bacterium]